MTIELKTGKKGELHISSEDDRLLHCRSFGTGAYVLSGCAVTMTSANKAHIAEGELMVQGGYIRITGGGEDVTISNGIAGQKRNTVIALKYTRDSNGIEAMSFVAVDGTSTTGTPSDPTVTTNNINTGASSSSWKFARIQLDGLTVGTPQILFTTKTAALLDQVSSLSSQVASLRDSISHVLFDSLEGVKTGNIIESVVLEEYDYVVAIYSNDLRGLPIQSSVMFDPKINGAAATLFTADGNGGTFQITKSVLGRNAANYYTLLAEEFVNFSKGTTTEVGWQNATERHIAIHKLIGIKMP